MLQIETNDKTRAHQNKKAACEPRGGIRMRPNKGMRQEVGGHEQAGLRDVLVPVRACLGIALLGLKVDAEQAVTLVIAVGPGELVLQRPHEVTVERSRRRRLPPGSHARCWRI